MEFKSHQMNPAMIQIFKQETVVIKIAWLRLDGHVKIIHVRQFVAMG